MKKIFGLIVFITIVLALLTQNVFADSFLSPEPSKIEIENGDKVFYMTPPSYDGNEYLPSGLYLNTTMPEVIYLISSYHTINDISYFSENNVFLSNDGMCFSYIPIPISNNRETNAPPKTVLEFYANGNLIKRYNVSQLVRNERKLSYSVSMVMWEKWEERQFDSENNTLSVTTVDDITYTFDIETGNIVSQSSLKNTLISKLTIGIIIICFLAIIFIVLWYLQKKKNNS